MLGRGSYLSARSVGTSVDHLSLFLVLGLKFLLMEAARRPVSEQLLDPIPNISSTRSVLVYVRNTSVAWAPQHCPPGTGMLFGADDLAPIPITSSEEVVKKV